MRSFTPNSLLLDAWRTPGPPATRASLAYQTNLVPFPDTHCCPQWQRQTRTPVVFNVPASHRLAASSIERASSATTGSIPWAISASAAPWPMPPQITARLPASRSTNPAWLPQESVARPRKELDRIDPSAISRTTKPVLRARCVLTETPSAVAMASRVGCMKEHRNSWQGKSGSSPGGSPAFPAAVL